jgi:hypothetical protein
VRLTIAQTATFVTLWKQLRLDDEDLRQLERVVMEEPSGGVIMRNTGGVRKMRFSPASRGSGKSGAYRVCYRHFPVHEIVFLLLILRRMSRRI